MSVVTYEPYLHLNLSELSPVLLQNKQLLTLTPASKKRPEDTPAEESRFEDTDEALSKLEDQLNEISSQEQSTTKQTCWKPCPQQNGKAEDQPAIRLAEEPAGNQAADSHSDEFRIDRRCTTTTNTPAPKTEPHQSVLPHRRQLPDYQHKACSQCKRKTEEKLT